MVIHPYDYTWGWASSWVFRLSSRVAYMAARLLPENIGYPTQAVLQDGREISVGDCALFRPPKDSPPFIGLIRLLALNKDNKLQLGGVFFFGYLFSPLPVGVVGWEVRVWDQQEVDQLLYETRTEMHVTLLPGGRSPKQANGSTSTPQLIPTSDSGQNSESSFPSEAKGKKRERGDHGADPVKRERSSRLDDGDSVQCKTESNLKYEIARITENGGVTDLEGVKKLVQLMQPDRKTDLVSRAMLISVIASTDKVDCLEQVVKLRGLLVLDDWLQDFHKGRIGDGNNITEGDKSMDEFLLLLLRALDKLPVDLQALQMCNIGRSVNHLRSHENIDIQSKARTLVDTWKKRVEVEMMSVDARVQRGSGSCRSLGRSCSQHMRSVLPLASINDSVSLTGDNHYHLASSITTSTGSDSFFKDGRKISVGDCALFKPPKDSPPFIGLIRWLALNKDNKLQLGVNWLYRSSELKLEKGTLVDSAPNEIFYSFQKHEIPAASLLHPCKVAFLPRGVELPTRTSSFVCRRAYDIVNKSLRWLTDQHHINDQQEEVDQLLYKTRTEMNVTLQPGGRSPKQANGPTSTSQPKPASDSGQNSGSSFPSQAKGKKRERGDHGADPVKRERSSRLDDGDSVQCKTEGNLKYEIARITENGGVMDLEGVEKLVQLMQPDRRERKMDLVSRAMLASVIASTDKVDCLKQFVKLRGLLVLDEWLQDIHKGKIGDGNNIKDGDKSVEEFLLVLLRALDKLPVNLQALQMCNIGRSVNQLRSHKNIDIQRKARTLVDTWKKRVEAEMMSTDAKSGSTQALSAWPSKSRLPEVSHGRSSPGESGIKYATSSPGHAKPAPTLVSGKEGQPRTTVGGPADVPQMREDRSSSSNQSHSYGQSFSMKDDLKSSASGSVTVNKTSSNSTRSRKSSGFPGTSATGSQKETGSSKSSPAHRSTAALEKLSHSALNGERVVEGPISEGSSHKLIVKIPNRARSPAQGVCGGSLEDPSVMSSRAASPVLLNKHEQSDHVSKDKSDATRCNVASDMNTWQSNDPKDVPTGSEGAGSPAVRPDEEQSLTTEDSKRLIEGPPTNQSKSVMLHASSFSPMNALIESCVKYSEATSSLSLEDDVGMNLLASVAAGEMSRSNVVSPADSTERSTPAVEEVCTGEEAKSRSSPDDCPTVVQNQFCNDAECDGKKKVVLDGCSQSDDGLCLSKHAPLEFSGDRLCAPSNSAEGTTSKALPISVEKVKDGESNGGFHEVKGSSFNVIADSVSNCKSDGIDVMATEEKGNIDHLSIVECKLIVEDAGSKPLDEGDCNKYENEGLNRTTISPQKLTAAIVESEFAETASNEKLHQPEFGQKSASEAGGVVKVEPSEKDAKSCTSKSESLKFDEDEEEKCCCWRFEHISLPASLCPGSVEREAKEAELTGSRSASIQPDEAGKCTSTSAGSSSSASGASDPCAKMKFDLNEGYCADEEKYGQSVTLTSAGSTTVQMINSLPFPVKSIPSGHSACITVASVAKGQFVPPEDLLRSKVELGWKGSAATSAFRPAEPRKVLDMAIDPSNLSRLPVNMTVFLWILI
ncbi:hypothetical protein DH2020_045212 [Rehmannia glutinosa]|uniref:Uncharacterized protein n=1 Tax=Rehmannia glutinosa TaxID=99300 RepID=A0ABR0UFH8_REHGL